MLTLAASVALIALASDAGIDAANLAANAIIDAQSSDGGAANMASMDQRAISQSCTQLTCPGSPGCNQQLGPAAINGEEARVGYDINPGTGNVFLAQSDVQLRPAIGPTLEFTRYYNSQSNGLDVGLGRNWSHSFAWTISQNGSVVTLHRDNGQNTLFTLSGGVYTPQVGEFGTLIHSGDGFHYTTKFGTLYKFNTANQLTSIKPADDSAITLTYSGAKLNSAVSGAVSITFDWTGAEISDIKQNGNASQAEWIYGYSSGLLTSVRLPNTDGIGHYGRISYGYSNVSIGGQTFYAGSGAAQLTEVAVQQNATASVPLYLFSYANAGGGSQVIQAAAGYDGTSLLRNLAIAYSLCQAGTSTATTTFADSTTKTIVSTAVSGFQRVQSIGGNGGSGAAGELPSESYVWNSNLTLRSFTNGRGYVRDLPAYDSKGNPTTVIEAQGDAVARTTTFTYHPVLSRPLTMSRAAVDGVSGHNHVMTWDYNSDYGTDYNTFPTNFLHQVVESGFTDSGLSGGLADNATYTAQIYYNPNNQVTKILGPLPNAEVAYSYWPSGPSQNYLQSETWSATSTSTLSKTYNSWDPAGRLKSVTDANSTTTTYAYDPLGMKTRVTISQGTNSSVDTYTYDLAEDLVARTTPEGTTLSMTYDSALRMWEESAGTSTADGGTASTPWTSQYNFDRWSHPIVVRRYSGIGPSGPEGSTCDNSGKEQLCREIGYDSYRRLSYERTLDSNNNVCSGSNCVVLYTYDGNGNLSTRSEAGLNTYKYDRDALDRVSKITLPNGGYSTVTYDVNDHLASRRDPKDAANGGSGGDRLTTYLNDDFGRLIKIINPDIGTWISNYDQAGNLTASQDALGARLTYTYDLLGRRTALTSDVTSDSLAFNYDETGTVAGYLYTNTAGRPTSIQARDASRNRIFTHYSYDYRGRVITDIEERGPDASPTAAAIQYRYNPNGDLATMTYPDGLVATYKYSLTRGYAPTPKPDEIDIPYAGVSTSIASSVNYLSDGVVGSVKFGNGSTRAITRNLRGEWTSLTSGPPGSPVIQQTYGYDPSGLGELTSTTFFSGRSNSWVWKFGYDSLRRLVSYTTNVRPTTDSYTWSYDEVGNRTAEVYNGSTTVYQYDSANITNQLARLAGAASRTWSYDLNGDVVQDHVSGQASAWNQYTYSTRHQLERVDGYVGGTFSQTTESYLTDGAERRWQKVGHNGNWAQFYYDLAGRVIQEYQNNGSVKNGCPAYDIVDHLYLETGEVARSIRQFASSGGTCAVSSYGFTDKDILYVHEDGRATPFGAESKQLSALTWEAETSPFGVVAHEALPGPDGKIGTVDDVPYTDNAAENEFGLSEGIRDVETAGLAFSATPYDPRVARSQQAGESVIQPSGTTPYSSPKGGVRSSGIGAGASPLYGVRTGVRSLLGSPRSSGQVDFTEIKRTAVANSSATSVVPLLVMFESRNRAADDCPTSSTTGSEGPSATGPGSPHSGSIVAQRGGGIGFSPNNNIATSAVVSNLTLFSRAGEVEGESNATMDSQQGTTDRTGTCGSSICSSTGLPIQFGGLGFSPTVQDDLEAKSILDGESVSTMDSQQGTTDRTGTCGTGMCEAAGLLRYGGLGFTPIDSSL